MIHLKKIYSYLFEITSHTDTNITRLRANTSRRINVPAVESFTTLVATVSNDFVRRLPGVHSVHARRSTNAKNRIHDYRLGDVSLNTLTETVEEKRFY